MRNSLWSIHFLGFHCIVPPCFSSDGIFIFVIQIISWALCPNLAVTQRAHLLIANGHLQEWLKRCLWFSPVARIKFTVFVINLITCVMFRALQSVSWCIMKGYTVSSPGKFSLYIFSGHHWAPLCNVACPMLFCSILRKASYSTGSISEAEHRSCPILLTCSDCVNHFSLIFVL